MIPGSMGMSLALRYSSDQNLLWCLEPESHLRGGGQPQLQLSGATPPNQRDNQLTRS
jgi:hypothetical protein